MGQEHPGLSGEGGHPAVLSRHLCGAWVHESARAMGRRLIGTPRAPPGTGQGAVRSRWGGRASATISRRCCATQDPKMLLSAPPPERELNEPIESPRTVHTWRSCLVGFVGKLGVPYFKWLQIVCLCLGAWVGVWARGERGGRRARDKNKEKPQSAGSQGELTL